MKKKNRECEQCGEVGTMRKMTEKEYEVALADWASSGNGVPKGWVCEECGYEL